VIKCGVGVYSRSFLALALDGTEWSTSRPGGFPYGKTLRTR